MGRRKRETATMGKALIKDRFRGKTVPRGGESFLHTTEMNDGYEARSLNLQSLTEQTSMDDFLMTAELAGRDFTAEKENVQIVTPQLNSGILSGEKLKKVKEAQDLWKDLLRIPRRPPWKESTPADKLRQDEHISFLEWRRNLARVQEEEHITVTPYEKNLEFWRQLWRVIERSDVVVQIVDARNPLLFWCPDVDKYVREVDPGKQTLLLINKADLLTHRQRQAWAQHFASHGVRVVFWSAVEEAARLESGKTAPAEETEEDGEDHEHSDDTGDNTDTESTEDSAAVEKTGAPVPKVDTNVKETCQDPVPENDTHTNVTCAGSTPESDTDASKTPGQGTSGAEENDDGSDEVCDSEDDNSDDYETYEEYTDDEEEADTESASESVRRSGGKVGTGQTVDSKADVKGQTAQPVPQTLQVNGVPPPDSSLLTTEQLLSLFRSLAQTRCCRRSSHLEEEGGGGVRTVGMVGYPNVGKSSTINTILRTKKVAVSATPGRTKHFQTLYVEKDLVLCDCPGLVFPSFVNSKAELVINGILPIDQLQDSEPPVELVCHRVGRSALEAAYHLNLPPAEEWEEEDKAPSAYDLLQAYGALRGFMSHKGNPDRPRAARYILKDFVNGKLLFCHPPPGIEAAAFQKPPYGAVREMRAVCRPAVQKTASEKKREALDKEFFAQTAMKAHVKGPHAVNNYVRMEALRPVAASQDPSSPSSSLHSSQASVAGKPWKRHNNRNKKEKLRRVYKDWDL